MIEPEQTIENTTRLASVPGDLTLNAYVLGLDGSRQRLGRQMGGPWPDWDKSEVPVHQNSPTTTLEEYQAISTFSPLEPAGGRVYVNSRAD